MVSWLVSNLANIGALCGALVAVEKVLEGMFPNASVLKKVGSVLGGVLGILPKSQ